MNAIISPEEKIIFSGDMLIQSLVPFILHSTREYWYSLKYLKNLTYHYDLQCLIPGHGELAFSQEEIIQRIEKEQSYLQKLIWKGLKLIQVGISLEEIKKQLMYISQDLAHLQSHQISVHTFLRDFEKWETAIIDDLNID